MHIRGKKKLVLLGMMSRMPVAGVVWQTVQYLAGFERLGYEVYYVEAHACTPSTFIATETEDGADRAAGFIAGVMRRFGWADRWAFHALHADGRCYGLSEARLRELYGAAALLINLHGGTMPLPEHSATGRLVFLETDPVELQMELYHDRPEAIAYLEPHCAFFTFGENYGRPDCKLPVTERFAFRPTRQPVVLDFWDADFGFRISDLRFRSPGDRPWTTVGSWRQEHRDVTFQGEVYRWSKHHEFLKFLELPARTAELFELTLSGYGAADRQLLETKGWRVQPAAELSGDLDAYREYIARSRGEFTVAKDQNVRLRTGWFSDRSAAYLAAGRPVITQETGFRANLPTGRGLFGFETMDDILAALDGVSSDYAGQARAAREIAQDYFAAERVLGRLAAEVGL